MIQCKLLSPSEKVRNLGVIFDSSFRFSAHVSSICSSSYYHIRDFARIRRYLDKPTAIAVANALVTSRLDYCNSLLNSISEYDLKRLNSIQYSLCRIVQRISRFSRDHMSPHLRSLHWLPVKQRIKFKWCLLIFKTLRFGLPPYFGPYFVPYTCNGYLLDVVLHLNTYLVMMLSPSIEIFTNPSCTLIIVLLLVARWSGIASLKGCVVVILYILFGVN